MALTEQEELEMLELENENAHATAQVPATDASFGINPFRFDAGDTTAKGGVERPGVDTISGAPFSQTPPGAGGAQARNAAKILPAVGMMGVTAAMPPAAGFLPAVMAAGLGGAAGEAGRQIIN